MTRHTINGYHIVGPVGGDVRNGATCPRVVVLGGRVWWRIVGQVRAHSRLLVGRNRENVAEAATAEDDRLASFFGLDTTC